LPYQNGKIDQCRKTRPNDYKLYQMDINTSTLSIPRSSERYSN
jgi:hypothetical protein